MRRAARMARWKEGVKMRDSRQRLARITWLIAGYFGGARQVQNPIDKCKRLKLERGGLREYYAEMRGRNMICSSKSD